MALEIQPTAWMFDLLNYLKDNQLLDSQEDAKNIVNTLVKDILIGGELYKKGSTYPQLKCIPKAHAESILAEVHEGSYFNLLGGQSLAAKILRAC